MFDVDNIKKLLLVLCACFFCGCADSPLDSKIKSMIRDKSINQDEWTELLSVAKIEGKCVTSEGVVNDSELMKYVKDYASRNVRGFDVNALCLPNAEVKSEEPIRIKFFLERSGSMVAYDSNQTKGDFKDAISTLLNRVPQKGSDQNIMFVVNDAVYPFPRTFKEFLVSNGIFNVTNGVGNPAWTDFSCIFDSIMNRTLENELSILVSDLIYSPKNAVGANPERILNEARNLTTSVFRNHEGKDVVVVKLLSDYRGKYYPYNSPAGGVQYQGNRPFYMMFVANSAVMNRLFSDKLYEDFVNFATLKGFENYYCFTGDEKQVDYSFVTDFSACNRGKFKITRGSKKLIHSLEDIEPDRNGKLALSVAMDLSLITVDDLYKENPDNYLVESLSEFKITSIKKLGEGDKTNFIKNKFPNATHLMVIEPQSALRNETFSISFLNKMPKWIEETGSQDDRDVNSGNFSSTTFAFTDMMQGIYNSFHSSASNPVYLKMKFNTKR